MEKFTKDELLMMQSAVTLLMLGTERDLANKDYTQKVALWQAIESNKKLIEKIENILKNKG